MKSVRRLALAALLALASVLPVSSPAPVATAHAATVHASSSPRAAGAARKWGVAGAIICGVGIRLIGAVGPQPAVIAVAISGCTLALLDVITTEE